MSTTSGFEERENIIPESGFFRTDVLDLLYHARSLEAQNEELKAMLRKHEFDCVDNCPECGVWKEKGHSPDCALAKLIK